MTKPSREAECARALAEVMQWISVWSPGFLDDAEWAATEAKVKAVLSASPPAGDGEYARGLEDAAKVADEERQRCKDKAEQYVRSKYLYAEHATAAAAAFRIFKAIRALLPKAGA